jgi:F0F1-type ATP synthase epsilon subunit
MMKLRIMTKSELVVDEEVSSVTLPCFGGELTALDGHDMLLTELIKGSVRFQHSTPNKKLESQEVRVGIGCAEITQDSVRVFVSNALAINERT